METDINNPSQEKITVTFGGWYQRTTLHLTEVYDFLAFGKSKLNLRKDQLRTFHKSLNIKQVSRENNSLEYVKATTKKGIEIRYYEDGLYVLELKGDDIKKTKKILETYFEDTFNPAIAYIFSLGAPTPKILANIKNDHPTVVLIPRNDNGTRGLIGQFGHIYNEINSEDADVYKTHDYIFLITKNPTISSRDLVENLIFFREFKDQLEKYLNIHRIIWEEISDIKDRKKISGKEVGDIRSRLDSYQSTINLISNRIGQMGSYVGTRSSISKNSNIEEHLNNLFQFKFETLADTLEYIKEVWKMTNDHVLIAINNLVEIKNQGATRGIHSLQVITSIGVISGIIGYLSKNEIPKFTFIGAAYFLAIIFATWLINLLISKFFAHKKYDLKFSERKEDI